MEGEHLEVVEGVLDVARLLARLVHRPVPDRRRATRSGPTTHMKRTIWGAYARRQRIETSFRG